MNGSSPFSSIAIHRRRTAFVPPCMGLGVLDERPEVVDSSCDIPGAGTVEAAAVAMPIEIFCSGAQFHGLGAGLAHLGVPQKISGAETAAPAQGICREVFGVERCARRASRAQLRDRFERFAHPHGLKLRQCVADGDALQQRRLLGLDVEVLRWVVGAHQAEQHTNAFFVAIPGRDLREFAKAVGQVLASTLLEGLRAGTERDAESNRSSRLLTSLLRAARASTSACEIVPRRSCRSAAAPACEADCGRMAGRIQRKSRQRPLRGSELRGGRLDVAQSRQPIAFHDVAERRTQFIAPATVAFVVLKVAGERRQSRRQLSGEGAGNRRTVPSSPATITAAESSVKRIPEMPLKPATLVTTSVSSCGVSRFHTRTVLSRLPLASRLPPALNARAFTDPAWADQVRSGFRMEPSRPARFQS